jgi:hypothetical protein
MTDNLRARLADALAAEDGERNGTGVDWPTYADALLPLVEAYGRACAADALRGRLGRAAPGRAL